MMRFTKCWRDGRLKGDHGDCCCAGESRQSAGTVGAAAAAATQQTLSAVTLAGLNWAGGLFGRLGFPPGWRRGEEGG